MTKRQVQDGLVLSAGICVGVLLVKAFEAFKKEKKSATSFADLRKEEKSATSSADLRKKEGSGTSEVPHLLEGANMEEEKSATSFADLRTEEKSAFSFADLRKKEGSGTSVVPRFPEVAKSEAPCPPKDTNAKSAFSFADLRKKEGSGTSGLPSPVFSVPDYMVKVVCFIDSSQTLRTADTGIIIDSNGTILVRASSLYNCKAFHTTHSLKALKRQVKVILRSGGSFCGIVKHVDHVHSFAIVKIDCPVSLPTAKVLSSSSLRVGQQILAVGITMRWTFVAEPCTIRGVHAKDKNVGINGKCQNFFHVDWKFKEAMPTQPGLFATLNGEVVGLKRSECPRDGGLVHGLPIECIAEILQDVKEHSTHILRCLAGVADVSSSMNVSLMKTQSQEYEGGVETAATDGKIKKPERVLSLPIMFLLDKPLQLYEEEVETVRVL